MLSLLIMLFTGCASSIPPGSIMLKVDNNAAEDSRYNISRSGTYTCYGLYTECYLIDLTEHRIVWNKAITEGNPFDESITFSGSDGQAVNVDVSTAYQILGSDEQIVALARKYTAEGIHQADNLVNTRVRDATRDSLNRCAQTMTVEQIYGERRSEVFDCALLMLQAQYEPEGLHIERLNLNGAVRLPATIQTSMEARISMTADADRVRREVDKVTAEGEKTIAAATAAAEATRIQSEAQATADKLRASAITPETLRLRELEIQAAAIEKWNGQLPVSTSGQGMFIPLPATDK